MCRWRRWRSRDRGRRWSRSPGAGGFPVAGFTLIELMIAMVVLQIGILALIAAMPLAQVRVTRADHEVGATQLLRDQLESLAQLAYGDSLLAGGGPYTDPANPIGGVYSRRWTVVDDQPITGTKTVTVTVSWNDGGRGRQIAGSTVLARY